MLRYLELKASEQRGNGANVVGLSPFKGEFDDSGEVFIHVRRKRKTPQVGIGNPTEQTGA